MLDQFGIVWRSKDEGTPEKVAALGAGRPLGFHLDNAENLIVCNTPAVSPKHLTTRRTGCYEKRTPAKR